MCDIVGVASDIRYHLVVVIAGVVDLGYYLIVSGGQQSVALTES